MTKTLFAVMILGLGHVAAFAQVDTAWVRRYNGQVNGDDFAYALAVDSSGNIYVTGKSAGNGTDDDVVTIKYYPDGDTAWVRRYDGPQSRSDSASAIAVDDSGNVYVTGFCDAGGFNTGDYATIKYHPDGDTAWVRTYDGPGRGRDDAHALTVDSSGNVYVTGKSVGDGTGNDYATIKYYPNGDTAWVRRYNGSANGWDCAYAIAVDDSGNVYVAGKSYGHETSDDYGTIKYYPEGGTAWVRTYDGPGNDQDAALALGLDSSGNAFVTGYSSGVGTSYDYTTIKYAVEGDTAWVRTYTALGNYLDLPRAMAVNASGEAGVTGHSNLSGPAFDYLTIKYYPDGDTAWMRGYNGPAKTSDDPSAIAMDGAGNVYVTGYSSWGIETSRDYATIKYYHDGDSAWVKRYNGPANSVDAARAIAVRDPDTLYVTGYSRGDGTGYDYATIKYVQTGSLVEDETGIREKPSQFTLLQNYPNPFNQSTYIRFTVAKPCFVSLRVYDLLGRAVKTLVSEHLSSGYKSVRWDGKNERREEAASGVYVCKIKAGEFTDAKKMVLLK